MTTYAGKQIALLSGAEISLAETDVANCLDRAYASPDEQRYNAYFASLQDMATAIQAEKQRRAG